MSDEQLPAARRPARRRAKPTNLRNPTISDVAALAGVSNASVSRVLNNNLTVDADISARVTAAVATLRYKPSTVARGLALGRTNTVAVVVPDLENPMFQEILRGVMHAAAADGYRVLVTDTEENPNDEESAAREARRRCDALVLISPRLPAAELDVLLAELQPVILVNRQLAASTISSVSIDYAHGMQGILTELHRLGHRRVAYLAGPTQSDGDRLRRIGIEQATRDLDGLDVQIVPTGSRIADGDAAVETVVSLGVTATVTFNDLVAVGLLSALHRTKIAVPAQMSVVGFDDIPFATFSIPALSTVSVPRHELGLEAWNRLYESMSGAKTAPRHPVTFQPRYVARESAGAPPQ